MIEVRDLKVHYGQHVAVDRMSFSVERGSVYGLIGPNGAGKTTTIKAIATLIEPTYGEIVVDGIPVLQQPEEARGASNLYSSRSSGLGWWSAWEWQRSCSCVSANKDDHKTAIRSKVSTLTKTVLVALRIAELGNASCFLGKQSIPLFY